MTAVDELKEPDCANATYETEKDAEVEQSDYETEIIQYLKKVEEEDEES